MLQRHYKKIINDNKKVNNALLLGIMTISEPVHGTKVPSVHHVKLEHFVPKQAMMHNQKLNAFSQRYKKSTVQTVICSHDPAQLTSCH